VAHTATSEHALAPERDQERHQPDAVAAGVPSLLRAYNVLVKPRVSLMVIITAAAGLYLGDLRSGVNPLHLQSCYALLGITLVTCGSSILNQALERRSDARMTRTRNRPMVTGRIGLMHGLLLGFACVGGGTLLLASETNILTTTLTLLTAIAYVAIYTPLKRITSLNTFIGAFPGALPPLIGWTAARGLIEWPGVALFAVLFVWQFPHFMAIGWMYRDEYRHGGIRLAATQQPIGWAARSTVFQALFYAVLMIPVALWTTFLGVTGIPYAVIASVLSLGYLWYTIRFAAILRDPSDPSTRLLARSLLKCSVLYLPLLMAAMLLNAQGRAPF
jgi:protoheme IX farnesyltransferase